jgi:ABC-type polysaccharide/polyol phosphate transport system ATPase subunit
MKLATMEHHQVAKDEKWESAKQKLSHSAIPIILSKHELNYNILIPTIGQTQGILNHVSRWGKHGDMVALLGSYESGKTTLLNCLVDHS